MSFITRYIRLNSLSRNRYRSLFHSRIIYAVSLRCKEVGLFCWNIQWDLNHNELPKRREPKSQPAFEKMCHCSVKS